MKRVKEFFLHLCICHSVIPELDEETKNISYNASSPDEEALVKGATLFGFRYQNQDHEKCEHRFT